MNTSNVAGVVGRPRLQGGVEHGQLVAVGEQGRRCSLHGPPGPDRRAAALGPVGAGPPPARRSARRACSSRSSRGARLADGPPEQKVGERRVAGQDRAVQVGPEDPSGPNAVGAGSVAVADPVPDLPGRGGARPDRGDAGMILVPAQRWQRQLGRRARPRSPQRPAARAPRRVAQSTSPSPSAWTPSGPTKLVPRICRPAHTARTAGTSIDGPAQAGSPEGVPSCRAASACGRSSPPPTTYSSQVAGTGVAGAHGDDLGLDAPPAQPLGQDDGVSRVAVGTEEVGKKKADGDGRVRAGHQASRVRSVWNEV